MDYLQYIIPAAAMIIVQLIISAKQERTNDVRINMTVKEIKDDISRLEKKQDKHNDLIERVTKLEMQEAAQWRWIDAFKDFKNKLP